MQTYKTVHDIENLEGKRVLVRSELNTPIENGKVADAYRVENAVPTIRFLSEKGARVIVMAHLGRNPEDSLEPVYKELQKFFPQAQFVKDVVGDEARRAVEALPQGGVLLLENLRSNPGEKENSAEFAQALASLADVYVDDAFGNAHRNDASMTGVPKHLPSYAGLLMERELTELSKGLAPESPSVFILGGAKFETKEPLLEAILPRYDTIFIGGALANDFLKAKGCEVGKSLVSEDVEKIHDVLQSPKILVPKDVVVKEEGGAVVTKPVTSVLPTDTIVDVGRESVQELGARITHARCVLWNGPLGLYEEGYTESTREVARSIAESETHGIVGGGDTVACVRESNLEDKVGFLSTGGGAMLDYLVDGKLPAVDALQREV